VSTAGGTGLGGVRDFPAAIASAWNRGQLAYTILTQQCTLGRAAKTFMGCKLGNKRIYKHKNVFGVVFNAL
jgi:hypothetical protein